MLLVNQASSSKRSKLGKNASAQACEAIEAVVTHRKNYDILVHNICWMNAAKIWKIILKYVFFFQYLIEFVGLAQGDALSLDQNTDYTFKDVFVLFINKVLYTRRPVPSTDQALPSCFYFRISWILMKRPWKHFFGSCGFLQGLRS